MFMPLQMRVSKRWLVILLSISVVLAIFALVARKYIWLYVSRKPNPRPPAVDLLQDPHASRDPKSLLAEANRLAWRFNSPKTKPLSGRSETPFTPHPDIPTP